MCKGGYSALPQTSQQIFQLPDPIVLHDFTVPCYHPAATLVAIDPAPSPGVVLEGAATLNVSVFPPFAARACGRVPVCSP